MSKFFLYLLFAIQAILLSVIVVRQQAVVSDNPNPDDKGSPHFANRLSLDTLLDANIEPFPAYKDSVSLKREGQEEGSAVTARAQPIANIQTLNKAKPYVSIVRKPNTNKSPYDKDYQCSLILPRQDGVIVQNMVVLAEKGRR